ncbi:hypothetical protein WMY93_019434 [Mugilogobius chulae]|uniref:Proline rich 15 n=1 Tax=Mugilogobius chulae TaxID=88201 RepID=A0AAW0NL46_9GOBI
MTERTPWWKAFLPKKKTGTKDSHAIGPDFDPWAPRPEKNKDAKVDPTVTSTETNNPKIDDDRYDDSHLDSMFNEKTCRRNMNVSRSGRFKEKRRIRQSLPIEAKDSGAGAGGR